MQKELYEMATKLACVYFWKTCILLKGCKAGFGELLLDFAVARG